MNIFGKNGKINEWVIRLSEKMKRLYEVKKNDSV